MVFSTPLRLLLAGLLLTGCGGGGGGDGGDRPDLFVEVVTDLRPGFEFHSVRTDLLDALSAGGSTVERPAVTGEASQYLEGLRVATFQNVTHSELRARVSLLDSDGRVVLDRTVMGRLGDVDTVITVMLTRDCSGVTCPGADDDPSHAACLGGRCVDPRCTPETPEYCEHAGDAGTL